MWWRSLDVCETYDDAKFSRKLLRKYMRSLEWDRMFKLTIRRMRDEHGTAFVVALEMRKTVDIYSPDS